MSRRIAGADHSYSEEYRKLQNTQKGKLIFTAFKSRFCGILYRDGRMIAVDMPNTQKSRIGAVYIGKIKNIVKNIEACFVEIADREICYLSLKDINNPEPLNRVADGRLLEGDEILVQICRDAQKTKQAVVTTKFALSDQERQAAAHRVCFSCIRDAAEFFVPMIEQVTSPEEYEEILTDDPELFSKLKEYTRIHLPEIPVRLYEDKSFPLSKLYKLEAAFDIALDKRIWLKSGAYLVIEQTEAMTVIDVNSGKYDVRKANDEAISKINQEAAEEIALQLRLRNLAGIIIIDFISMKSKEQQQKLLEYMRNQVSLDRQKTIVVDITPLGLVEITRKRERKPLSEQFANVIKKNSQ